MNQTADLHDTTTALAAHAAWFQHRAATQRGQVHELGKALLTAGIGTAGINLVVSSDAKTEDVAELLNEGILLAAQQGPDAMFGCWSASADIPRPLLGLVLSRGLSWGWQPRWMSLPLGQSYTVKTSPGVTIRLASGTSPPTLDDVPYQDGPWHSRQGRNDSATVTCFVAIADRNVIGTISLCLHETASTSRASLHDLGVSPQWRTRGVGRALTCTALNASINNGVHSIALNSTPDGAPLYTSLGFTDLGFGQTWWLHENTRHQIPTDDQERQLVNAIALDDTEAVSALPQEAIQRGAHPLTCQMTAMQLAAKCKSDNAARGLQGRGLQLDLMSASQLGFDEDVKAMIASLRPDLDRLDPKTGTTLLHDAVREADVSLAKALLKAGASTEILDSDHHMTAIQWLPYVNCPQLCDAFRAAGHGN